MVRKVLSAAVKGGEPSVDEVTQQLMTWIGLSMRLADERPMTDSLGLLNELGLTLPQLVALHVIAFGGPTTMTRLIERVGLSTSAVSALLNRLVEMGLCDRQDDPVDRRQRRVHVTTAGQDVIKRLLQSRMKDTRGSIEPLSTATRCRLSGVLTVVNQELGVLVETRGHAGRSSGLCGPVDVDQLFDGFAANEQRASAGLVTNGTRPTSKLAGIAPRPSSRSTKTRSRTPASGAKPKSAPNKEKS